MKNSKPEQPAQVSQDPNRKFSNTDYNSVVELRKVAYPTTEQKEEILRLYRKYIQPVWGYIDGCNCALGISSLWTTLNQYVVGMIAVLKSE